MHGFTAPLYFAKPCSRLCRAISLILHAFACAVCIALSISAPIFLVVMMIFAVSLWLSESSLQKSLLHLSSALLRDNDEWLILTSEKTLLKAKIARSPFISTNLMILFLQDHNGENWILTLGPDNTPADARRRLFVRLRFPITSAT